MLEIAPGLWHWSAPHERIHLDVSSYYLRQERVLIDAMIPAQGLDWFREHGAPEHVVMSNRHHDRHAWRIQQEFASVVHCPSNGLHEVRGRGEVEPFDFGDELPGGIRVYEVDSICPDESALHIPAHRALACADGVVRWPGQEGLVFVPDDLMDEPEQTKSGLRGAYQSLLGLDFELLLLAHGEPLTSGAREALRAFIDSPR
jgi:hypothetical protein